MREGGSNFCVTVAQFQRIDGSNRAYYSDLLRKGAKVTVNSDDPAYFQSYISDDMFTLATAYELTMDDVILLAKNSFDIAWISEEEKQKYMNEVDTFVYNYKDY